MTAMLIAGIDPSAKKIAIVAQVTTLQINHAFSWPLYLKGETKQTVESLGRAVEGMERFLSWADMACPDPDQRFVWVEDPLIGRGGPVTTMKQSYVGGIVRGLLVRSSFRVYGVNVSSWKSQVCGDGRADKRMVALAVGRRWPKIRGLVGDDGDLTDAAAICLYGAETLRKSAALHPSDLAEGRVS